MCVYCYVADTLQKYQLPTDYFKDRTREVEYHKEIADLIKRVKELEEKVGCPCEPSKKQETLDFLTKINNE